VDAQELGLVEEDTPAAELAASEERDRLYAALARLPAKQRAVLTLKLERGLSYKEISEELGGTAGAARVNYCQALKTLKKYLKSEDSHEMAMRPYTTAAGRLSRR